VPRLRTRQFQRSSRPNRAWAGFANTSLVAVAASTKILIGGFSLSNPNIDETVLRTVGTIAVMSDQQATTEDQLGAFGMIAVTDLAAAAGAASIPGPITDRADDGWFVYVSIVQRLAFGTSVGFHANGAVQYHFDSKAKRRFEEGTQIAIMVENASSSTAFSIMTIFRLLSMVSGTGR